MQKDGQNGRVVRFGVFEADLLARELRKRGVRVRLQEQPFRLLQALLERPGQIVTREEIKDKLWPDDTFVDFDKSLNTAAQKLRQALGDSAESPRFLETIPRQGYRFLAPVESGTSESPVAEGPRAQNLVRPIVYLSVVAAVLAAAWFAVRRAPPASEEFVWEPKPATALPGAETSPSLSPDGTQVAFAWSGPDGDNTDIYVQVIGAAEPLRLTTNPAADKDPSWAPDGSKIAFVRELGESLGVFVMSPHGSEERMLAETPRRGAAWGQLAWTADSQEVVFKDRPPDERNSIYAASLNTGARRRLSSPTWGRVDSPFWGDRQPAVSPDGRWLAFIRANEIRLPKIFVKPMAGGEERELPVQVESVRALAWTPDSQELIYVGPAGAHRILTEGGQPTRLRIDEGVSHITISPSGRMAWSQSDSDNNIWRLNLDSQGQPTGPPTRIASTTRRETSPQISPDGNWIVFSSDRSGPSALWLASSDGSNPVQLTTVGYGSPRWAPDSRRIAFDSSLHLPDPSGQDIFVTDISGSAPRNLTNTPERYEARPAWSQDGRWIYYRVSSFDRATPRTWKISAEGGEPVLVSDETGADFFESVDGEYLYFSQFNGDLWRVSTQGGAAEFFMVFDQRLNRLWSLNSRGIFWVNLHAAEGPRLELRNLSSGDSEVIAPLSPDGQASLDANFLSVSEDGRTVVYRRTDRADDDIYYVDDFR